MRILFLYDTPNWAIHNVGQYWASLLGDDYGFEFAEFGKHTHLDPEMYDYVFWGYAGFYRGRRFRLATTFDPFYPRRWRPASLRNAIAIVHDPSEICPQVPDWRTKRPDSSYLRFFSRLGVTSGEMLGVLRNIGIEAYLISTNSRLPIRNEGEVKPQGLRVLTKADNYPRKNLALFAKLQSQFESQCDRFSGVIGRAILPQDAYMQLLDEHNCYICTSWQEGGPIPLMDAMNRGCAILTTPVGQTDRLVEHGYNGYFCTSFDDFADKIRLLTSEPARLLQMRLASLEMARRSSDALVRSQLVDFLAPSRPGSGVRPSGHPGVL